MMKLMKAVCAFLVSKYFPKIQEEYEMDKTDKEYEVYFDLIDAVKKGLVEKRVKKFKLDSSEGAIEAEFFYERGEDGERKAELPMKEGVDDAGPGFDEDDEDFDITENGPNGVIAELYRVCSNIVHYPGGMNLDNVPKKLWRRLLAVMSCAEEVCDEMELKGERKCTKKKKRMQVRKS